MKPHPQIRERWPVFFFGTFVFLFGHTWADYPAKEGFAPVNGIKMFYEIYGQGDTPLILLPGGGSTIDVTYSKLIPLLAASRKVIAIEEQAHGRTTDRDKPLRFETSADDVAALLKHLGIARADLLGFSNGGNTALQVAIRHPEVVRKLVLASTLTKKSGAYPKMWKDLKQATSAKAPEILSEEFLKVNPNPIAMVGMFDKCIERMNHFTDLTAKDFKAVQSPTLIVAGDRDIVKPEHAVEMSHWIAGARLAILPGGHGEYLGELLATTPSSPPPKIAADIISGFLNAH